MKKFYFLLPLILLFCVPAFAKVFRVGYFGTPLIGVDYPSIKQAADSANAGDTIQIYGHVIEGQSINKRVVILGFGHDFSIHPGLQSNPGLNSSETAYPSLIAGVTFGIGSDSSIVEGCDLGGIYGNTIYVQANNLIFRNCGRRNFQNTIYVDNITNLKIIGCENIFVQTATANPAKNVQMFNCINSSMALNSSGSSGSIINCYDSYPNTSDAKILIKNCILSTQFSGGNIIWNNNIFFTSEPNPSIPGMNNKWGQNKDSVFVGQTNLMTGDENAYQLRSNSPAKNFGVDLSGNPTDCGIFGGELAYRYKVGGQPAIPAFYKLSAPTNAASSNPYNITVSVRSNN